MPSFKRVIFLLLSILAYFGTVRNLFGTFNLMSSLIFFLALLIFLKFFFLSHGDRSERRIRIGIAAFFAITTLFIIQKNPEIILANMILHVGIGILGYYQRFQVQGWRQFSAWRYTLSNGYITTFILCLTYSFALLGIYAKLPFSCQDLENASHTVMNRVQKPVDIKSAFSSTVKDVVNINNIVNIKAPKAGLRETIQSWRDNRYTNIIQDQTLLNTTLCEFALKKIETYSQNTVFQGSILVLMVLTLYSFGRLLVRIIDIISYLILQLLILMRIFIKEKVTEENEHIR